MLYTAAPSTWPTGSKPVLRIAANSPVDSDEPQVLLRRISAIRAAATEGSPLSLPPSATRAPFPAVRRRFHDTGPARAGISRRSGRPIPCCARAPSPAPGPLPPGSDRGRAGLWPGSHRRARPCDAGGSSTSAAACSCRLDSQTMATLLQPGRISPLRQVPADIPRPEYVGRARPKTGEPDIKDAGTIERMRAAGKLAARALAEVGRHVAPGVTTDELDRIGHEFLTDHGAYPSTLGYRGFPKSLCTSVNEVICHGIPDDTVIADGDIVNVDITALLDGVHGDTNATFLAGDVDEESRLLVERTHEAMMRGIRVVAPGRPLNAIGRVIESYARRFQYGVVRDSPATGSVPPSIPGSSCRISTTPASA